MHSPLEPLYEKREACMKAARQAYERDRSLDTFERVLRECEGADLVNVRINLGDSCCCPTQATLTFSDQRMVGMVIAPAPGWKLRKTEPHKQQSDFVARFKEFMTAPDACYIIGRSGPVSSREDPSKLRAAAARLRALPIFRPGLDNALLGDIPLTSVIFFDPEFQEDLLAGEPPPATAAHP